jgi:demethylmenaquinone methyltransferase/2-methoxy-6-polyprenyl-1,4-benzoquinol methylase
MAGMSYSRGKQDSLISADENRYMFDRIAGFYDGTNRVLSLGLDNRWRRTAVSRLAPQADGRYLDVGCGTADVCIEILRQNPNCTVLGIDPSEKMLEIGRDKIEKRGLADNIRLESGDALNPAYEDDSFHGAITSFCVRNVTDRAKALSEIRRVVKPGGRLVILELTNPSGPIMGPLFGVYSRVVIPTVTRFMSSTSAYRYLTDSMAAFPQAEEFIQLIGDAGFTDLKHRRLTGGIVTVFTGIVP